MSARRSDSVTSGFVIGEDATPVYRPHGESLEVGVGVFDRFTEVELLNIEGIDGETACLGWVLHHGYTGALPAACNVRGLRVRCGNIQVGDDRMFEELFPEARFNGWSVGELHVIDPRIIPNGRRDHFEQSVHFHNLLTHLRPSRARSRGDAAPAASSANGHEISSYARSRSARRQPSSSRAHSAGKTATA